MFFNSTPDRLHRNFWAEFQAAVTAFELQVGFTREDVEIAFRRLARKTHPDAGGTPEAFQNLVSQRDLLLNQAGHAPFWALR